MKDVTTKTIIKELPCKLTDQELIECSRKISELLQEKAITEQRKKEVMADYNARIAKLEADISILSRKIQNGEEHRPVECVLEYHWSRNAKVLRRTDTGEIVYETAITEEERQQSFINEGKNGS